MYYQSKQKLKAVFLTEFGEVYKSALELIAFHEPKTTVVRAKQLILAAVDKAAWDGLMIDSIVKQSQYFDTVNGDLQRDLEDFMLSKIIDLLYPLRNDGVLLVSFYDLTDEATLAVCWDHSTCLRFDTHVKGVAR